MNFYELLQYKGIKIEKGKGEHIFMQGDTDTSLYFIQSGFLKAYYISESGKESIKSFLLPKDVIGSLTSIHEKEVSSFSLLCMAPSVVMKLPIEVIYGYAQKDLGVANKMIEFLLNVILKKEKREYEFLCLSAEERFCKLEKINPMLINKASQNDLARYLGVTPVGLSRIKKRAHSRN